MVYKCNKGYKNVNGKCVKQNGFVNPKFKSKIINTSNIIIVSSIIFLLVMSYFFLPIYSVEVNNGELVTSLNVEKPTLSASVGLAKALISFAMSASKLKDANKYGVYIINADKIKSTSKSTCLKYNFSSKTPCYYYKCPSKYLGYEVYKMNGNFQCLYIKYPMKNY